MTCCGRTVALTCVACAAFAVTPAAAKTITAASCSQEDVQAAVDAASDGDTVAVPPGTATWRTAIFLRGGTGVIFDNQVTGRYGSFVLATNYRSSAAYAPWGKCDGSSRWDGNQEPNGYPAIDQIGRSTDSGPGTRQELDPLREWNNTLGGDDGDIAVSGSGAVHVHIKEGRDFLNDAPRPDYVPYTYPHPSAREHTAVPVEQ